MVVYRITNTVNGKIYIGCSVDFPRRLKEHLSGKYKGSKLLFRAIQKHGAENFSSEILQICESKEDMFRAEIDLIKSNNSIDPLGYNLHHGGKGGLIKLTEEQKNKRTIHAKKVNSTIHLGNKYNLGRVCSDETRSKISLAKKGKKLSEETKSKMSLASRGNQRSKGIIRSDDYKKQMSLINKGKVFSEATKLKMSDSAKLRAKSFVRDSLGRIVKVVEG